MISYEPLWITLKKKGVTQYQLINKYHISAGQLSRLRANANVSTHTLNRNFLSLGITLLFHIHKGIIGCRQALDFLAFRYFL